VLDRLQAELLLPLPGRSQLIGVMALGPKQSEEPYSRSDRRLLSSVALQTGLAIENSTLVHTLAQESAQRQRIAREIEIARQVQERLLPQSYPVVAGVDFAGLSRTAQEVGGDYYDFIPLDSGRLGIAIGDVSGKGISAALLMAGLRASLRAMTINGSDDLAKTMRYINRLVYESSAINRYATFFFAILDPVTLEMQYVNAGHNPPMLVRGDSPEVVRLEAGGTVVGLLPEVIYQSASVILRPGDILICFTDGISEAMDMADEEWSEERMLAAAQKTPHAAAEQVLRAVFQAADEFTGEAPQHDDMTLLLVRVKATLGSESH